MVAFGSLRANRISLWTPPKPTLHIWSNAGTDIAGGDKTDIIIYFQYKETSCSRDYNADAARIFSPGWPHHYDQYLNCRMTVTASQNFKIQMYFNEFDVEDDAECNTALCDYLDI